MGDVYLAFDPNLERTVAVKVLSDAPAADADRLARFVREAKAASALNHPNILTVYDFAEDAATHYIVTEYVDGRTLRAWAEAERPGVVDVLEILAQAASALAAAHGAGIVHRDVKPENLMVRRDGFVKVLDFGIAKLLAGGGSEPAASTAPQLQTQPGTILGTTRYMSPEQALGTAVDARADVWSLGVVLYELVAGHPPFDAPTPMGTLAAIVGRAPEPLASAAPGTPEAMCAIVAKALAKAPEQRYETAAEMAAALASAARELRYGAERSTEQGAAVAPALEAPAPATEETRPEPTTNLPPRGSALVGRERELAEIASLLRTPSVRLLTLTGPGGTGKTRLAVEAGRELFGEFADGVFAVDLSPLSDPQLLASHVAGVLGVRETPGASPADELCRYFSDKRQLLVLDNFEHLLEGTPLVSRLLAAAPGLTVLATSQAALRLSAEREYAVEPLEVPIFSSLPPLDELARTPAVALFVERAREAKASFAFTAENARAVVEICRRLDGLPLAIELAAARVKLLAPPAMLERLDRRLKLLTGGARDLPSRQQTMRGAVAWSYDLLDEAERALLRRLAVFAGGSTLEAAEAVCEEVGIDVLDAIGSLVDKSLLTQRELESGEERFTMLEVVREYALEQLEVSGESDAARLEHARYFQRLAKEAWSKLQGADQAVWVKRLAVEYDNIKAALGAMFEREPEHGVAFAASLSPFWSARSRFTEQRAWVTRALETGLGAHAVRARLLSGLSMSEVCAGDLVAAAVHGREAVEASRASGDRRALATALSNLGAALMSGDDVGGAQEAWQEGLAIARELADGPLMAAFLGNLGEAARSGRDFQTARAYYEQALESGGRHTRYGHNVVNLGNLGAVSLEEGDFAEARAFYREALSIAFELGDRFSSAGVLEGLAALALGAGDGEQAARLAGAAEVLCEMEAAQLQPFEQSLCDGNVAKLRATLDPSVLEREWARGRAMSFDEAVREALGQ